MVDLAGGIADSGEAGQPCASPAVAMLQVIVSTGDDREKARQCRAFV
ncbi:hypothetical protein [Xanthomonas euvesicatoria]|nr:hypothetical protein [Xanthomonas euvesicatoria]